MSDKLKTAVLGLNEHGLLLLEASAKSNYFQIQAIADKDSALVEKAAQEFNCTAYDDYRQLIIQNQFDCLLVAEPLYSCDEHLKTAIKKKFNILKLAPPARNFEEAAEFVQLAEDHNINFAIANPCRFANSYIKLKQILNHNLAQEIILINANCTSTSQTRSSWQTDPKLAGGGVILRNCYLLIDQILNNFPIPQQVYALNTNQALDRQQRLYLTEDTAVVTMKFTDTLFANLTASRTFGTEQRLLTLYSKNNIITVDDTNLVISDAAGNISEKFKYDDDNTQCMTKLLDNFALGIVSPEKNKFNGNAKENLKNMAVIEAAYLSAKTAMPEEPAKILQIELHEPTNIWPAHK